MGYRLKFNKNKDKVKIWSTITDSYITDFMLISVAKHLLLEWAINNIQAEFTQFPIGWIDKDTDKRIGE